MMQSVRSARLEDIEYLVPHLRAADLAEVAAASALPPANSLAIAFRGSYTAFTTLSATTLLPTGMGGVVGAPERPGLVWFLGTNEVTEQSVYHLKMSRRVVDALAYGRPELHAISDNRNTVHHRWLKWVGFIPTDVLVADGFTHFIRNNEHV
jgi:hypothetical protein